MHLELRLSRKWASIRVKDKIIKKSGAKISYSSFFDLVCLRLQRKLSEFISL